MQPRRTATPTTLYFHLGDPGQHLQRAFTDFSSVLVTVIISPEAFPEHLVLSSKKALSLCLGFCLLGRKDLHLSRTCFSTHLARIIQMLHANLCYHLLKCLLAGWDLLQISLPCTDSSCFSLLCLGYCCVLLIFIKRWIRSTGQCPSLDGQWVSRCRWLRAVDWGDSSAISQQQSSRLNLALEYLFPLPHPSPVSMTKVRN